jgi:hypothetical protein
MRDTRVAKAARVTSGVRHIVERSGAQDGDWGPQLAVGGLKCRVPITAMLTSVGAVGSFAKWGRDICFFGPNEPEHEAHLPALGLVDMHRRQSLLPMSTLGQKQTSHQVRVMSALPQKRTSELSRGMSALCQKRTHAVQQSIPGLRQVLSDFRQ